jgi:translation initiation factor 2 alpha subunit (eIF-2alpha)
MVYPINILLIIMFVYRYKKPSKGVVVICNIIPDEENETCIYVSLPEYNNWKGLILKSELPKKERTQRKVLSEMKQSNAIICTVLNNPQSEDALVELTVKGIPAKHNKNIISRFKIIEKFMKIVKFVSIKFEIDYDHLIENFYDHLIVPLEETDIPIDEDKSSADQLSTIDDLSTAYQDYLRDTDKLIRLMNVRLEMSRDIKLTLKEMIREEHASSFLNFDLMIWKIKPKQNAGSVSEAQHDVLGAVYVLRELFTMLKKKYTNMEIRYIGAPKYRIEFPSIDSEEIDKMYDNIEQDIRGWLDRNIDGYEFNINISDKVVVAGNVSIAFPFKIE